MTCLSDAEAQTGSPDFESTTGLPVPDTTTALPVPEALTNLPESDATTALPAPEALTNLPAPEEVRATFIHHMQHNPEDAVAYLHTLGTTSGYLNEAALSQNIRWTAPSPYGEIECTVNLFKPEKDPRAIAAEAAAQEPGSRTYSVRDDDVAQPSRCHPEQSEGSSALSASEQALLLSPRVATPTFDATDVPPMPLCDLCWENEEFPGTPEHPAKPGLRIAPLTLGGERWGLQYSPYAYFAEHCIALSREHRPMNIDAACLRRLLDFVDQFPFYFIGANADLPIVGGSILSHDHFQGGRYEFPLMKAPLTREFLLTKYPEVRCGIVAWPASVLRLVSDDRAALLASASNVLSVWRGFSCEACAIRAATHDVQHNTLNPIVRKQGSAYIMDMVLRNNRTDKEHPWGIFHAPESTHHIKKENIGLIEIMGMAILPPRLAREFSLWHDKPNPVAQQKIAQVFLTILEATGVFKHDATGEAGWDAFILELTRGRVDRGTS